jgi:hypothetical protein
MAVEVRRERRKFMKVQWTVLAILLCLGVGNPAVAQTAAPAKPLTPLEQTLIANEKSFIAAAKKGDAEYLNRTFTDDYSMVEVDGQLHDRQEVLGDVTSGGEELTPYNIKVVAVGESSAIVHYDVIVHVPPEEDQGSPPRYQHWSSVWVKQGDAWRLKFQQTTPTHWGDW